MKFLKTIAVLPFFLITLVLAGQAHAATRPCDAGSSISVDTTWTIAESPYVIDCSLTVDLGVELSIDPGVVVKFEAGDRLNIDEIGRASCRERV